MARTVAYQAKGKKIHAQTMTPNNHVLYDALLPQYFEYACCFENVHLRLLSSAVHF